ncbi:hypothetical protein [uncultured Thiodictyon sp.]|uniref:hypothetical protein n=1 Tax=uncultured Thiodictyon sp. TaxID=1846217 RepID=UPI0025CBDE3D|nr:hypothetical protein [uncultured Thiodictyon sp.]
MSKRHTRSTLALAVLLAGALALPGLAAADGGRGWGDGGRGGDRHHDRDGGQGSEWRGERHDRGGDRGWGERRHHDHHHGHGYGYREERPAYHPEPPRPPLPSGLSVFFNRSW